MIAGIIAAAILFRSQTFPAGQPAQPAGHLFQDAIPVRSSFLQTEGQVPRPPEGGIHYHTAVHHEEDPARRGTFSRWPVNLTGQGEDRHVDAGGLARRRRQGQCFRPGGIAAPGGRNPAGQPRLPGEWVAAVEGVEELIELRWIQAAHSALPPSHPAGRHRP